MVHEATEFLGPVLAERIFCGFLFLSWMFLQILSLDFFLLILLGKVPDGAGPRICFRIDYFDIESQNCKSEDES